MNVFNDNDLQFGELKNALTENISTLPTMDVRSGLIGEWLFNGNANDTSGYGNNGTVNGATLAADWLGKSNNAYSFNGIDNYIAIPCPQAVGVGLFSFSVSFTPSQLPAGGNICIVFEQRNPNYPYVQFALYINSAGKIGWVDYGNVANTRRAFLSTLAVAIGNNYKVTVIRGTNQDTILVNGAIIGYTNATSLGNIDITTLIFLGCEPNNNTPNGSYYKGIIDSFTIHNRQLTTTEIEIINTKDIPQKGRCVFLDKPYWFDGLNWITWQDDLLTSDYKKTYYVSKYFPAGVASPFYTDLQKAIDDSTDNYRIEIFGDIDVSNGLTESIQIYAKSNLDIHFHENVFLNFSSTSVKYNTGLYVNSCENCRITGGARILHSTNSGYSAVKFENNIDCEFTFRKIENPDDISVLLVNNTDCTFNIGETIQLRIYSDTEPFRNVINSNLIKRIIINNSFTANDIEVQNRTIINTKYFGSVEHSCGKTIINALRSDLSYSYNYVKCYKGHLTIIDTSFDFNDNSGISNGNIEIGEGGTLVLRHCHIKKRLNHPNTVNPIYVGLGGKLILDNTTIVTGTLYSIDGRATALPIQATDPILKNVGSVATMPVNPNSLRWGDGFNNNYFVQQVMINANME